MKLMGLLLGGKDFAGLKDEYPHIVEWFRSILLNKARSQSELSQEDAEMLMGYASYLDADFYKQW